MTAQPRKSIFSDDELMVVAGVGYALTGIELFIGYHFKMPIVAALAIPQAVYATVIGNEYRRRKQEDTSKKETATTNASTRYQAQ